MYLMFLYIVELVGTNVCDFEGSVSKGSNAVRYMTNHNSLLVLSL